MRSVTYGGTNRTAVLVLFVALAGCTSAAPQPTAAPWPAAWETTFCGARESLSIAANRLEQGVTANSADSLDKARVNARDVLRRIEGLPAWPAGESVRTAYDDAGAQISLAVGVALTGDGSAATTAAVAVATANTAYDALSGATGFRC